MANLMGSINENECKQFENLLVSLQNSDNDVRSKAESLYDELPPEKKLLLLFTALINAQANTEIASFAAVLLRRVFFNEFDESFVKLPPDTQAHIRSQLLNIIQQDINPSLRKKICDATAELARKFIDDDGNNNWPEFLKFMFDMASSPNYLLKEASLLMFSSVPGIFANLQARYMDVIRQMLLQCLADSSGLVRCAAAKALTAFICAHDSETNIYKHFTDCLPLLMQELGSAMTEPESEELELVLKNVVDVAELCPNYFRSQLENLFDLCVKIISNTASSPQGRHLALEVVVTLSETAPAMTRKLGLKSVTSIIPLVLNMMVDLEDEEDWSYVDDTTDDDNDSDPAVGESSLDRFACALGGKTILPLVMRCVPEMLSSSNWKYRHAALMAISAIAEGCNKQMEAILTQIVDAVIPFLQDPHPRVRYASCNALGQMATDFAPLFEKKFHEKVIVGLLQLLGSDSSPRVQAHAGAALVNFFEECPKNILCSYLEQIVQQLDAVLNAKIVELAEKGTKLVLEQVVVTLAAVADTAEEKFCNYYDRFMPCLKYVIQNAKTPELKLLRGKTIECVSLIGLAVGREKFVSDASEVMNLLLESQTEGSTISDDDPQLSYMISAWARICKILGKSFEPYLPYVMSPVMKAAALKPEIAVLDSDDMKVIEDDDTWQFISLGEQNFGIKTAGLEEKATACQMLVCYARELKEAFCPYVEEVAKLMVSMLKFYFHDSVRTAAGECLPHLLESAQVQGDAYIATMWQYILPELLQAIESEPEREVLSEFLHSFALCIELLKNKSLTPEHMNTVVKVLDVRLKEHFERLKEREEQRKGEDYDEVLEEDFLEQDDDDTYMLSKIADIIHALFAAYKTDFFPCFDMLLHHFVHLVQPDRPWSDRQWGLCIFDDLIEHGGPDCSKYQQHFLQPMIEGLRTDVPEVRQAAAYGIGILGQFGGPQFAKICADTIPLLSEMINASNSRSVENISATENAISAVTKILMHNNSCVYLDDIIPTWLSWLPVWEDQEEAPHVYNFLCTLLEQNNHALLGENNCNLPKIVMILAEALFKEAIDLTSDVGKRVVAIISYIQGNKEVFMACVALLNPAQQKALHAALTPQQ